MDEKLLQTIDEKIQAYEPALIRDAIRLIRIPSVMGKPEPGAPFGPGPQKMLDEVLLMGKEAGFVPCDYQVGVVSLALKEGPIDLGIWAHGDVVDVGEGWSFPPFEGILHEGCIIGRGACDNKGQLSAVFQVLSIFKELGIALSYNPALYVGSNEECGMGDLAGRPDIPEARGFCKVHTPPRLSLVPDGGFPLGYGAQGLASFYFESKIPLQDLTLTACTPGRSGYADAVFHSKTPPQDLPGCTVEGKTVTAFAPPIHSSHPDPERNVISQMITTLLRLGLYCPEDQKILGFLNTLAWDITGKTFGFGQGDLPAITVHAPEITSQNGRPTLALRVHFPVSLNFDQILARMEKAAEENGFSVRGVLSHVPYENPVDTPVPQALIRAAREVTGEPREPFFAGSTYAHHLPNAYVYGMSGCLPPDSFPKGRGLPHGVDECVSVERLKRAMRIYARALLALDELKW